MLCPVLQVLKVIASTIKKRLAHSAKNAWDMSLKELHSLCPCYVASHACTRPARAATGALHRRLTQRGLLSAKNDTVPNFLHLGRGLPQRAK